MGASWGQSVGTDAAGGAAAPSAASSGSGRGADSQMWRLRGWGVCVWVCVVARECVRESASCVHCEHVWGTEVPCGGWGGGGLVVVGGRWRRGQLAMYGGPWLASTASHHNPQPTSHSPHIPQPPPSGARLNELVGPIVHV